MPDLLKPAILSVVGTALATSAVATLGPHTLLDVSQTLLRAYNARDASAFHQLLAPSLQAKHSVEEVVLLLTRCRALTHDIDRFSIPSWGARNYGFFGVYAETSVLEMILEIDENGKIIHWVITDDVTSKHQQCAVTMRE
jgi:hypothetical protein